MKKPLKTLKIIIINWKLSKKYPRTWQDFAEGVLKNILFTSLPFKRLVKKTLCSQDFTSNLRDMIPTNLVKIHFYPFLFFRRDQKHELNFRQVGGGNEICSLL